MPESIKVTRTPLVEALVEVRFPGDTRIEVFRGEFQARIRPVFPNLLVPKADQGVAPALQHYRFVNDSATNYVSLAVNSFAFSSKEYPGWVHFLKMALTYWKLVFDAIEPVRLTRVGVRFINRFDEELIGKMKPGFKQNWIAPLRDSPHEHRSTTLVRADDQSLIFNVAKEGPEGPIVVDLDSFAEDVKPDALEDVFGSLHEVLESHFFSILRGNYVTEMRVG